MSTKKICNSGKHVACVKNAVAETQQTEQTLVTLKLGGRDRDAGKSSWGNGWINMQGDPARKTPQKLQLEFLLVKQKVRRRNIVSDPRYSYSQSCFGLLHEILIKFFKFVVVVNEQVKRLKGKRYFSKARFDMKHHTDFYVRGAS